MSTVIDAASRLRFERAEMPHVYAVALHTTIIEQFHSCIAMVEADAATALHTLASESAVSEHHGLILLHRLVHDASWHYRVVESGSPLTS
jgi:hypothetical protein